MPEISAHPSRERLNAYNLGQLPPDEAVAIESHISECEPCCDTIINLSSDDTFVGLLKQARQLPNDQTVDHASATPSSLSPDIPVQLSEHPRYEIVGLIGKGGMGDVYEARHRKMERTVALKVINRGLVRKAEAVDRFHREVKAAAQLSHPNIVTAYDADQAGEFHFMVMEYVDGVDLSRTVKDRGALPVAEACDYIRQAAIGLQHAHERGMVHRDIKPHNLMVTADGTVKILDFGLASLTPEAIADAETVEAHGDLTAAGAIMGTPDFISPEQADDARGADIRSDIYSLGATLYFLLSGRPPFAEGSITQKLNSHAQVEPEPLTSLRENIPIELAALIAKMMAKDPEQRFQVPTEVAAALQALTQNLQSLPNTPARREGQPGKKHIRPRMDVATLLLLLAVVAAVVANKFAFFPNDEYSMISGGTESSGDGSYVTAGSNNLKQGETDRNSQPRVTTDNSVILHTQGASQAAPALPREPAEDTTANNLDRFQGTWGVTSQEPMPEVDAERKTTAFLIDSAKRGDRAAVQAALEAGVNPNGPSNQLTALHWAVAQRLVDGQTIDPSPEITKLLIEAGADVNARDYLDQSPLEWAAKYASPEIVQMLIKAGADVNAESSYGTVLMAGTQVEIAKLLIEAGADVNAGKYTSPLATAAKCGNVELIRLLVEKGAKVNDPKDPPIHWAGKPEAAKVLIEAGADVNQRNAKGESALNLTQGAWIPTAETVELLIEAGVDVKAKNATGSTPLHAAIQLGQPEIAKLLIAAGADVDAKDEQGNTPLSIAHGALSWARRVHGVDNTPYQTSAQLLVDAGAKDDGRTALQRAVAAGNLDEVKKRIAAKADVNETGPQRITAVHLASEMGQPEILAELIEAGGRVDAVDAQRMRPLHLAANAETVRLLIANGAEVNTGMPSPLYMATMDGKTDVVRELLQNDANVDTSDCVTLLNWATFAGQIDVVKVLFELRDAKVLLAVRSVYSPLHVATSGSFGDMGSSASAQQRLDIARLLVEEGAEVNARWGSGVNPLSGAAHMIGTTPLMFASQRGEEEMVRFLLGHEADPKATNASDLTALHFAAQNGNLEVVELLLKAKADVNALTREAQTPLDLTQDAGVKVLLIQEGGKTANEVLKDSKR
jgi:ankyrin repeat protein/serine/threonine protein kinase